MFGVMFGVWFSVLLWTAAAVNVSTDALDAPAHTRAVMTRAQLALSR
jgi:hypothetical protein